MTEHPVNHGGFSNIYFGRYENSEGFQTEVALKVLKIFENQTEDDRVLLHRKFVKEVLVWRFLRHESIIPLFGVFQTASLPSLAMVSPWMPRGSVLKYIGDLSPSSTYAMNLVYPILNEVIQGLMYLHSENVVHGDLCGRNILIDNDGRARLTDFGLAAFLSSETSVKSSTRAGSTRWMAPELVDPPPSIPFKRTRASDVWAFGCVCCEIWTEGDVPFSHLTDTQLILAISKFSTTGFQEIPYPMRPHDKGANPMPDRLWDLTQSCFLYEPFERPTVSVLADRICEMMPGDAASRPS
ncbi:kinase-like domain-containing protein, partial [Mycena leptocephala]